MMLGKGYIDVLIVDRPQGGKAYTPAEFATSITRMGLTPAKRSA